MALATIIFHGDDDPITPGVAFLCSGDTTSGFSSTLSHAAALAILAGPNITPVTWHAIGGGQAGFDGQEVAIESATQGADGGEGGSWASDDLDPGAFTIQIGTYGAANGDPGGDTWVKVGGITRVLARGGGSASTNVGASINAGGRGDLTRTNVAPFTSGMGGNGGGGAGGPDGPGGDCGDVSPKQFKFGAPATTTHNGGTGGGAGNGGKSGYTNADAGTFHTPPTFNTGGTSERIPGDGGDSLTPPQFYFATAGSAFGNGGAPFGVPEQSAFYGAGGEGGASLSSVGFFSYVNDSGYPGGVRNINEQSGNPGGYGAIWGLLPLDWLTGPVPSVLGATVGPGGGGGGGGGGNWHDDEEFPPGWQHRGWPGGGWGGGGGGGGNWVTGNVVNAAGASGNSGILVAVFDDAVASEGVASCCEEPVIVDADVVALLSERALGVAHLVEFDFAAGPVRLWNGSGELKTNADTKTWSGLRALGRIEGLDEQADMTATQLKLGISGVAPADSGVLAKAVAADRSEYAGRMVTIYLQFFNVRTWQKVGNPIARTSGIMDGIEISSGRDGENIVRTLTITAENMFYGRGIPPAGNYTDRDQQFRSPGDRGLEFISETQNTVIQVPW